MAVDISQQLITVIKSLGAKFSLNSGVITYEEVFSNEGMLPAIAKRADQLCSLCLGYGIGVTFKDQEDAKLGVVAVFDDVTPNILRFLCILDTVYELMRNKDPHGVTPLDELMYD